MGEKIKNPQTLKEQYDKIINQFDKNQLESAEKNNSVNVYAETEDEPSDFTHGTDFCSDRSANQDPEPIILKEMKSFVKFYEIDEKRLREEGCNL